MRGGEPVLLSGDAPPGDYQIQFEISPDSRWVLYGGFRDGAQVSPALYRVAIGGGATVPVPVPGLGLGRAVFTGDDMLFVGAGSGGGRALLWLPAEGGAPREVYAAPPGERVGGLLLSGEGAAALVVLSAGRNVPVDVVRLDTGQATRVLAHIADERVSQIALTSDGRTLVVLAEAAEGKPLQLYGVDL